MEVGGFLRWDFYVGFLFYAKKEYVELIAILYLQGTILNSPNLLSRPISY
jgi:hypothetical protein